MKLKNMKASFLFNQNLIEKKSGCKKCIFFGVFLENLYILCGENSVETGT